MLEPDYILYSHVDVIVTRALPIENSNGLAPPSTPLLVLLGLP